MHEHEAIRRLIAIYGQLLDSGRLEEWGELFTKDATFSVYGRVYRGRDEIVREIGGMQPAEQGLHAILQPVIDLDGEAAARSWTDLTALARNAGNIQLATIGRYHDRLVLAGGRWRFASRTLVMAGESLPAGVDPTPSR